MACDYPELTAAEAALWREVSELNATKPESWLCFVNAGHSVESAKTLFDRKMIEAERQMGMPVCRVLIAKPKGDGIDGAEPVAQYEAPRDERIPLRVRGVGRVADEPRALLVCLNECPTDDELRALHEHLRWWYEH